MDKIQEDLADYRQKHVGKNRVFYYDCKAEYQSRKGNKKTSEGFFNTLKESSS